MRTKPVISNIFQENSCNVFKDRSSNMAARAGSRRFHSGGFCQRWPAIESAACSGGTASPWPRGHSHPATSIFAAQAHPPRQRRRLTTRICARMACRPGDLAPNFYPVLSALERFELDGTSSGQDLQGREANKAIRQTVRAFLRFNETMKRSKWRDGQRLERRCRECSLGSSRNPESTAIKMVDFRIDYFWSRIVPENCLYLTLRPEA